MKSIRLFSVVLGLALFVPALPIYAHCDTLGGPVITAARAALDAGDVTPVLMWVKPADEAAIRAAFTRALAVRKQSADSAALADQWFFETLVRIHRAGEGAPFTGLKAGEPVEPGIDAADRALASGNVTDVLSVSTVPLEAALKSKLERVRELKAHAQHSTTAGREYVAAYVDYIHFAERLALLADKANAPAAEHEHGHE